MKNATVAAALLALVSCHPPDGPSAGEPAPPVTSSGKQGATGTIVEESPRPTAPVRQPSVTIESVETGNPLRVRGSARTFENAVSLRVRGGGETIAEAHTTAAGEMGRFNPWSAEIWLTRMPAGGRLTVDAIDYSAKDGSIASIASRETALPAASTSLSLVFPLGDCTKFGTFDREMPKSVSIARLATEALVAGPAAAERASGASSPFPRGSAVRSVILRDGVLTVDFNERLRNVGGSCAVTAIRQSVTRTLTALPGVRQVVITAEGSEALALQP